MGSPERCSNKTLSIEAIKKVYYLYWAKNYINLWDLCKQLPFHKATLHARLAWILDNPSCMTTKSGTTTQQSIILFQRTAAYISDVTLGKALLCPVLRFFLDFELYFYNIARQFSFVSRCF